MGEIRSLSMRTIAFDRDRKCPFPAWLIGVGAVLLTACGTQPPRSGAETPPARDSAAAKPADKPAQTAKSGGYYLDDGPDENPPANLDAVPDAEPKPEPLHRYANNPYTVFGRDYVPDQKLKPYRKRGKASWYGRRFHGQKTSSGERYDMYAATAAHPTLPIPSYARVTNVANGKSVVVRINDRGPFHSGRIIDLSYTAAYKLGYVKNGSTQVEVESILPDQPQLAAAKSGKDSTKPGKPTVAAAKTAGKVGVKPTAGASSLPIAAAPPPSSKPPGIEARDPIEALALADEQQSKPAVLTTVSDASGLFLQLAAFSSNDNAESFRAHLLKELNWLSEKILIHPQDGTFRLHLGPYRSQQDATRTADRIRESLDLKVMVVQR